MPTLKAVERDVPAAEVRAELDRILASEFFARSPRMQRFLEFIVDKALSGRSAELSEYSIGLAVFDRPEDFEPAIDPIVRNDARRLRFKLQDYYRSSNASVVVDVPKGGYVPQFRRFSGQVTVRPRLAVLPLAALTATGAIDLICPYLSASIAARLHGLSGLEIVTHELVSGTGVREATIMLNLTHVLHGSVLELEGRCRAILHLVDAATGVQLWAQEFELREGQMLAAQAEIVPRVVEMVAANLRAASPQLGDTRAGLRLAA